MFDFALERSVHSSLNHHVLWLLQDTSGLWMTEGIKDSTAE